MIAVVIISYLSNYLLINASCKRYFALLEERPRKIADVFVQVVVGGIFMFLIGVNATDVITARTVFTINFSPVTMLLCIIPLVHIVFGVLGYTQVARQNLDSASTGYQILSIQTSITFLIFLMWILWTVLYVMRVASGGINGCLLAIVFELENSIQIISRSVKNRMDASNSQHRSQTSSRLK
jgi:hypothetical protein